MFINLILLIFFSCIPLVLWGYGVTYLSLEGWNRRRFFSGMLLGGLSVWAISFLHTGLLGTLWSQLLALFLLFGILFFLIWVSTQYGSPYMRIFLRKTAALHSILFLLTAIITFGLSGIMSVDFFSLALFANLSILLFSAFLEEWVKHLSTLGLSSQNFRFSRSDFLIFTLFVTLGFVFVENLIYFIKSLHLGHTAFFTLGISRSFFSLLAHFFAASLCVIWWWKALSYKVFSLRYSLLFLIGFICAISAHTLFNTLLAYNSLIGILVFSVGAYIFVTQWLVSETPVDTQGD